MKNLDFTIDLHGLSVYLSQNRGGDSMKKKDKTPNKDQKAGISSQSSALNQLDSTHARFL